MEPLTASLLAAALTTLVTGTAGEAGKSAWATLASTTRRMLGAGDGTVAAVEELEGVIVADPVAEVMEAKAQAAAQRLIEAAAQEPAFGQALQSWLQQNQTLLPGDSATTNTVSGSAQVGVLIQGRDFHGSIDVGR
jgi:hypothetical protein